MIENIDDLTTAMRLLALGCSPEQFSEEAKLFVAVKLTSWAGCPRERYAKDILSQKA